jgi:hypothetical protein
MLLLVLALLLRRRADAIAIKACRRREARSRALVQGEGARLVAAPVQLNRVVQ